ncbi:unnamed protein product [Chondrus crispus]|uniref:Uncharacterized protein n=1 Tax=Chondrus crispus TaxID=2769 RepID=R7QJ05_CHOCR|nr:unnamed protein product [Chondrus crispus]CDF38054.1 unnamed protein product [Chondrus crispus]|eukprot:XP_005717923.1 unnamed protein product [Chondrus crispus]
MLNNAKAGRFSGCACMGKVRQGTCVLPIPLSISERCRHPPDVYNIDSATATSIATRAGVQVGLVRSIMLQTHVACIVTHNAACISGHGVIQPKGHVAEGNCGNWDNGTVVHCLQTKHV